MKTERRFFHTYWRTAIALVIVVIYLFPVYWMVATSLKTQT
jgi:ABC-type glycerol-3-phosphate transport system permease component